MRAYFFFSFGAGRTPHFCPLCPPSNHHVKIIILKPSVSFRKYIILEVSISFSHHIFSKIFQNFHDLRIFDDNFVVHIYVLFCQLFWTGNLNPPTFLFLECMFSLFTHAPRRAQTELLSFHPILSMSPPPLPNLFISCVHPFQKLLGRVNLDF